MARRLRLEDLESERGAAFHLMRRPPDPSVDTFRQRYAPFSSDPMGDFIEEQRMRGIAPAVRPGYQERFLDPTKVITEEGKIPPSLNAPRAAQYPSEITVSDGKLPPGFRFADVAPPDKGAELPARRPGDPSDRADAPPSEATPPAKAAETRTTRGSMDIASLLTRPDAAASISQWSRAYDRALKSRGAPRAMALFTLATRNLNNTLGVDVDPVALFKGQRNG